LCAESGHSTQQCSIVSTAACLKHSNRRRIRAARRYDYTGVIKQVIHQLSVENKNRKLCRIRSHANYCEGKHAPRPRKNLINSESCEDSVIDSDNIYSSWPTLFSVNMTNIIFTHWINYKNVSLNRCSGDPRTYRLNFKQHSYNSAYVVKQFTFGAMRLSFVDITCRNTCSVSRGRNQCTILSSCVSFANSLFYLTYTNQQPTRETKLRFGRCGCHERNNVIAI
jgi:hypothetical protein